MNEVQCHRTNRSLTVNHVFADGRLEIFRNVFAASRPRLAGACQLTVAIGTTLALMFRRTQLIRFWSGRVRKGGFGKITET